MQGNPHVDSEPKIETPPSPRKKIIKGPVSTSTKQTSGYFTVEGIRNETSLPEHEWAMFAEKELIDNSYDFHNDYYPNADKQDRRIGISVKIDTSKPIGIIRIVVRNSNNNNVPVFENLHEIFDFSKWYSTKRHQHRITAGALGDFLKRVLGMGYASWTNNDNPDDWFEDKQWSEPIILRFNGQEHKVFIQVDRENAQITPMFEDPTPYECPDFTEVEIALPIPVYWKGQYQPLLNSLERYYKVQRLAKSRIEFSFTMEEVEN